MLQFTQVADRTLANGINQHNTIDSLPEGYSEDILNMDVDNDALNLREGFDRHAGDLPLRVSEATYSSGKLTLILPDYVDMYAVYTPGPIYIQGRFLGSDGTYYSAGGTDLGIRYDSFTKVETISLLAAATSVTVPATQTLISSLNCLYQLQTWEGIPADIFFPDTFSINSGTFAVTLGYSTASNITAYLSSCPFSAANSYHTIINPPGTTVTISGITHGLPSLAIFPVIYDNAATPVLTQIEPDTFTIDASGNVTITFSHAPSSSIIVYLFSGSDKDVVELSSSGMETEIVLEVPNALTPHLFPVVYNVDINTETKTLVLPDAVTYDATGDTPTHKIYLSTGTFEGVFEVFYVYGNHIHNQIQVDVATTEGAGTTHFSKVGTDNTSLSMSVSGIPQDLLPVKSSAMHVNSYLNDVEVITAVDGFLYRDKTWDSTLALDTRVRIAGTSVIGPLFTSSAPLPAVARTRGWVVAPDATAGGFLHVTGISYNPSTKYTTYTLSTPLGYTPSTSWSNLYTTLVDKLTVSGLVTGTTGFNGTFTIVSIDYSHPLYLDVTVNNTGVTRDLWNSTNVLGLGGIFTDRITTIGSLTTFTGSVITLSSSVEVTVDSVSPTDSISPTTSTVYLSNVQTSYVIPVGERLGVTGTSATFSSLPGTLVGGDSLVVNGNTNRVISYQNADVGTDTPPLLTLRDSVQITDGQLSLVMPKRWELILPNDAFLGSDVIPPEEYLHSINAAGSLYFSSGTKYDGDKVYEMGIPNIQPQIAFSVVDGTGITSSGGTPIAKYTALTSASGPILTVTTPDQESQFVVNTDIVVIRKKVGSSFIVNPTDTYTILAIDSTAHTITLDRTPTGGIEAGDEISTYRDIDYFLRYTLTDRNGSIAVGRSSGSQLFKCRLTGNAATVYIRGFVPLNTANINVDYSRMVIDLYRRHDYNTSTTQAHFYKDQTQVLDNLSTLITNNTDNGCYFDFQDTLLLDSEVTKNKDPVVDPVVGGFGDTREKPLSATGITSFNNQMALSSLTGNSKIELSFQGTETYSSFASKSITVDSTVFTFSADADPTPVNAAVTVTSGVATIPLADTTNYHVGNYVYICQRPMRMLTFTINDPSYVLLAGSIYRIGVGGEFYTVTIASSGHPTSVICTTASSVHPAATGTLTYVSGNPSHTGDLTYTAVTTATKLGPLLNTPSLILGWYKIKAVNTNTSITLYTPQLADTGSTPLSYTSLGVYTAANKAIPLACNPDYFNMLHSVNNQGIINSMLPHHLASAINSVLFNTSGVIARGGVAGDYVIGSLELLGVSSIDVSALVTTDVPSTNAVPYLILFANGNKVTAAIAAAIISPKILTYPSRVILSESGYPEVFQNVEAPVASSFTQVAGSSAPLNQDVNPDDGEPITAIIPFFGESIFTAALNSMVLVIFKTHSIFVYDSSLKISGGISYLQKLESRGLGCEAGFSVTAAVEGIVFANTSGLYLLNRKMMIVYFGKMLETLWVSDVDVSSATVSNFVLQRKLRVSVTRLSDSKRVTFNLKLLDNTIDPTSQAFGYPTSVTFGWSRYEGIDAYQWSNFGTTLTVFASPNGYVGQMLPHGPVNSYADDGEPIYASILSRPMVFEAPATQKSMRYVTVYGTCLYEIPAASTQTYMYYDLGEQPDYLDTANLAGRSLSIGNGLSDLTPVKMNSVSYSPGKAKATWYQFEWTVNAAYLPVTITRIAYTVAVLRTRGNVSAALTK